MPSFLRLLFASAALALAKAASPPEKIYGVNLGSWLLIEPWMLPQEWVDMGGSHCNDCSQCIASEFAFAKAYPDTVDATFNQHWNTWFNDDDVSQLVAAGINTVRIPLGYWIVEPLVDRRTEFFPKGGILQLQRGLRQLRDAGIAVVLDHHALPGQQAVGQQFAGRCTNSPEFYTPYNYRRALIWTGVMTALSHLDPAFSSVFSIQAVNEILMDASRTPGLGDFQKNFVQMVRAVEIGLGVYNPLEMDLKVSLPTNLLTGIDLGASLTAMSAMPTLFNSEVRRALLEMVPVFLRVSLQLAINTDFNKQDLRALLRKRSPLYTNQMDVTWQYNNPSNPADAAIGPQSYDNHLYYSFGGVTDPNEEAYMKHICNLDRVENAVANRNVPLWFGEWSLATQFPASDEFLRNWADAQKLAYNKSWGWFFWNWKIENSPRAGDTSRQWSYQEGLKRGYFLSDPTQLINGTVCDPYIRQPE
ncbi:glycoside hydrolase family 5 protein [Coprinopsis sp. MPI-PUGE-AT-0042]|nr:glycoside hydrolase family 5 protein [Coprinopsis sp. MPI-PUGE-AT-0042]